MNTSFQIMIIGFVGINVVLSAVNVKLTNIECRLLERSAGAFTKCSLKAVKRDVAEVNLHFRLDLKPIDNATLKLRLAKRGSGSQSFLYQYKVDCCEFFRTSRRNPLAEIFYSFLSLEKYSNLNHTCPYDHDLILDHCLVNTKPLSVLPIGHGEYKIYTTWYVYEKPAATVDLAIRVS